MTSMCMHMRDDSPHTAPADARSRVNQYLGPPCWVSGPFHSSTCSYPGARGGSPTRRDYRTRPYVVQVRYLSICSIPSTQYTATRRIKSDYTRSAMWPSVAGESCESREAWAASLTTSCHLCLPVSRLHLPTGMRNSNPQPPSPRAPLTPTSSPRPGPQMAPRSRPEERRHASPPCTPGGRALPGDRP